MVRLVEYIPQSGHIYLGGGISLHSFLPILAAILIHHETLDCLLFWDFDSVNHHLIWCGAGQFQNMVWWFLQLLSACFSHLLFYWVAHVRHLDARACISAVLNSIFVTELF